MDPDTQSGPRKAPGPQNFEIGPVSTYQKSGCEIWDRKKESESGPGPETLGRKRNPESGFKPETRTGPGKRTMTWKSFESEPGLRIGNLGFGPAWTDVPSHITQNLRTFYQYIFETLSDAIKIWIAKSVSGPGCLDPEKELVSQNF